MKVVSTYKEALELTRKYIHPITTTTTTHSFPSPYQPPIAFIRQGAWKNTQEALEITLDYLMNYLHHACYVLCSSGQNQNILFKLEPQSAPEFLTQVIANEQKMLFKKRIPEKQKYMLHQFIQQKDKLRILQCILKKIRPNPTTSNEYQTFISPLALPPGVFILNLTDACLLTKNRKHPFPIFRGHPPNLPRKYQQASFLPIFSLSGQQGYEDIPIPNYDDVMYILGLAKYNILDFTTKWTQKSLAKAVFRGGPSGCGYTTETNPRIHLASMRLPSHDFDVGIVSEKSHINSNSIRFDPKYGLGMLATQNILPVGRLSYTEQSKYKYILHLDGNVSAYRLLTLLATGSLVLRVLSPYTTWIDSMISPGIHYLPIKHDLSDLIEKVSWCKSHDHECMEISKNALKIAHSFLLHPDTVRGAFQRIVKISVGQGAYSPHTPSHSPPKTPKKYYSPHTPSHSPPKTPKKYYSPHTPSHSPPHTLPHSLPKSEFEYIMMVGEKKCKKGYTRDKKIKNKCTKKRAQPQPQPPQPQPPQQPQHQDLLATNQSKTTNEKNFYILGTNEKKCKKGFTRDKKNKNKCVEK